MLGSQLKHILLRYDRLQNFGKMIGQKCVTFFVEFSLSAVDLLFGNFDGSNQVEIQKHKNLFQHPGVNASKLFSSSLTFRANMLECFYSFSLQPSQMCANKAGASYHSCISFQGRLTGLCSQHIIFIPTYIMG
jgi:hypothetical protein